jgi:hypothetical protein
MTGIIRENRMKDNNKNSIIAFFYAVLLCASSKTYDEIHRYRPILFFGESHIARDGLMDFKLQADHGSASKAYNACGNKVMPADIFGSFYSKTVACIGSQNSISPGLPCLSDYQRLTFTELILNWYQNFARGFFVSCYIPFRTIHLYNFPQETMYNPLQHHELMQRGMGDFACSLGWAYNYEATKKIDFIDVTIQVGVALPTSKPTLGNDLFDVTLGYEGRTAYFLTMDSSCGIFDWLTMGAHIQGLFFEQHLAQHILFGSSIQPIECLHTNRKSAWVAGIYSKADHMILGFSGTIGYSFTYQGPQAWKTDQLLSWQKPRLSAWSMHTIHLELDYDLATYSNPYAPSIGVAYNKAVAGKDVFDTSLWGGVAEITILFMF